MVVAALHWWLYIAYLWLGLSLNHFLRIDELLHLLLKFLIVVTANRFLVDLSGWSHKILNLRLLMLVRLLS